MPGDVDAGPPGRLGVGPYGVGVAAEAGHGEQTPPRRSPPPRPDDERQGTPSGPTPRCRSGCAARRAGRCPFVISSAEAERRAEGAQRRRSAAAPGPVMSRPLTSPQARPASRPATRPTSTAPALASDGRHRLDADHPGEDEHRADRQVEAAGDDHEGHADGEDQQLRRRPPRCCGSCRPSRTRRQRGSRRPTPRRSSTPAIQTGDWPSRAAPGLLTRRGGRLGGAARRLRRVTLTSSSRGRRSSPR